MHPADSALTRIVAGALLARKAAPRAVPQRNHRTRRKPPGRHPRKVAPSPRAR